MTIYWSSSRNICWYSICLFCCYSICLFCWYIINSNYNFITLSYWSISNSFLILTILTNTGAGIPAITFFELTIIFTFILTCFIIPFLIWITCFTIEFAFTITWNMFCHWFSIIFVCYHVQCFNIDVFCFFWNTYF